MTARLTSSALLKGCERPLVLEGLTDIVIYVRIINPGQVLAVLGVCSERGARTSLTSRQPAGHHIGEQYSGQKL